MVFIGVAKDPLNLRHVHLWVYHQNHYLSSDGNGEAEKGKAIPLQAWAGPEGSRKLRLPDFKTIST